MGQAWSGPQIPDHDMKRTVIMQARQDLPARERKNHGRIVEYTNNSLVRDGSSLRVTREDVEQVLLPSRGEAFRQAQMLFKQK